MQSHNEVLDFIRAGDFQRAPVLSIAPQTLASLSASYSNGEMPLATLLGRIRAFLSAPERGGWQVWDTTFARHVALKEMVREFGERRAASAEGDKMALPMLASACPGWVCYAEKAQGELLPLLSATRSPQGVMGALVKQWYAVKIGRSPDQLYHVTAMPCYDKKLEASREDFYSEAFKTRDTDCVLTTGELDLLLHELGFDPSIPVPGEGSTSDGETFPDLLQHPGSSSGSYLGTLLSALAAAHPLPTRVHTRVIRGSTDNVEVFLEDAEGHVLFKGAICYGFRNLQNLVRKVGREVGIGRARPRGTGKLQAAVRARRKARTGAGEIATPSTPGTPGTPGDANGAAGRGSVGGEEGEDVAAAALVAARDAKTLDFVEVMACPGGCVNGGGQMKPASSAAKAVDAEGYARPMADDGVAEPPRSSGLASEEGMRWSTKEWVAGVERTYWNGLPTPPSSPELQAQDSAPAQWPKRTRGADALAETVVEDMLAGAAGDRYACVRTRFRRVDSDVLSQGGLTHEQVKW